MITVELYNYKRKIKSEHIAYHNSVNVNPDSLASYISMLREKEENVINNNDKARRIELWGTYEN
jgi:hypothetical protein